MAKTLNQIAHEYAEQNPNVSVELAFLEGMLYQSKASRKSADTIDERRIRFKQELSLYIGRYGEYMINEFYDYWSELNKSGTKMRFEQQATWELSKRLSRWANNNKNYGNRSNILRTGQIINDAQSEEILFKANF